MFIVREGKLVISMINLNVYSINLVLLYPFSCKVQSNIYSLSNIYVSFRQLLSDPELNQILHEKFSLKGLGFSNKRQEVGIFHCRFKTMIGLDIEKDKIMYVK